MGKTGDPREQVSNASICRVKEQSVPGDKTAEISSELIQLRGCPRLPGRIQKKRIRIESRVLNEFVGQSVELIAACLTTITMDATFRYSALWFPLSILN